MLIASKALEKGSLYEACVIQVDLCAGFPYSTSLHTGYNLNTHENEL